MKKSKRTPPNEKKLRRKLCEMAGQVRLFLYHMDKLMVEPPTDARGRKIAKLMNAMEIYNDQVRYFWCGIDYRKDTPLSGELSELASAD